MYLFGVRIVNLRESLNLTQNEVAIEIGIDKSTWSKYENNMRTPTLPILLRIVKTFSTNIDFLLNTSYQTKLSSQNKALDCKNLASNLIILRRQKNETQKNVASELGISNVSLNQYEKGTRYPNIDTLRIISEYYQVSLENLFTKELNCDT